MRPGADSARPVRYFLNLAEVSLNVALELYSARLEEEAEDYNRAVRKSRRNVTPAPKKRLKPRVIDASVIRHLQELQQRLRTLRERFSCVGSQPGQNRPWGSSLCRAIRNEDGHPC